MKQRTRKALAFAVVPMIGAFALGPSFASADQFGEGRDRGGARHERMVERAGERVGGNASSTKSFERRIHGMLEDHGKHKGWFSHSEEARAWSKGLFGSIKSNNYTDFKDLVTGTPLGTSTTKNIFEKLALASDKFEDPPVPSFLALAIALVKFDNFPLAS